MKYLREITSIVHPKTDDDGRPVKIHSPSNPTSSNTWADSSTISTTVPGHTDLPDELHGVKLKPHTQESWKGVEGQGNFEESPMSTPHGLKPAVGVVMMEPDKRVWVVHPTNQFGGYHATFPKGRVEPGLNNHENAIKEVHEESGLKAKITGHLGDFSRTTTHTRYYMGERTGGHPSDMGWESQGVSLVPLKHLHEVLTNPSDRPIVAHLQRTYLEGK